MKAISRFVLFISLLISIGHPFSAAGAGVQGTRPSAPARASTTQQPADGGWPRAYVTPSGARLVVYEPQIASWLDQKRMAMYAAVSYTPADGSSTALGTIRAEADTKISVPERLVSFSDLTIAAANFPTLSRDQLSNVVSEINAAVPPEERVIGLDRVLAAFDASQVKPHNVGGLNTTPPPIFFSTRPAVLVNIDGAPVWSPIKDNDLRYAVNTNWDLFAYGSPPTYYLRVDKTWMTASNIEGPWKRLETPLPASFSKLPNDDNWKDMKAALGAQPAGTAAAAPTVFVSQKPAELMLLNGVAAYKPVTGTRLEWVSNTDSDVFRLGTTGTV